MRRLRENKEVFSASHELGAKSFFFTTCIQAFGISVHNGTTKLEREKIMLKGITSSLGILKENLDLSLRNVKS